MRRSSVLLYGAACYWVFLETFLYNIGFLSNLIVPKSIDSGVEGSQSIAMTVNLVLLSVFALQHSVMARPGFKRWWTRFVPAAIERSTYVLLSSLAFILLFSAWQPLPTVVWSFEGEIARSIAVAFFFVGIATVLYATCLIDHFDLFGIRQVVLYYQGIPYRDNGFATPSLYKHIRHPLYVGWFITFWATPDMTMGHLLLAAVCTTYILVAVGFEERDLSAQLGPDYQNYQATTPMFIPRLDERTEPRPHIVVPDLQVSQ